MILEVHSKYIQSTMEVNLNFKLQHGHLPVTLLKLHPVEVAEADVIPAETGTILGAWYRIRGANGHQAKKKS